jgi:hypothetical protein
LVSCAIWKMVLYLCKLCTMVDIVMLFYFQIAGVSGFLLRLLEFKIIMAC